MNELALFAGAGGGILGGKLLGWRTVCAVERDAYAAAVLAQRQNDGLLDPFPIWSDIASFDGRPWRGVVDVVSGGFPCTDISAAGKGAGIDGEASGLWLEMARIIDEVRPSFCFVENSPVLTSRGLGRVLGDLAEIGYDAEWGVLGAADVGAPHKRDRIWIVGHTLRNGWNEGGQDNREHDGAEFASNGEHSGEVADTESIICGTRLCKTEPQRDGNQFGNGSRHASDTYGQHVYNSGLRAGEISQQQTASISGLLPESVHDTNGANRDKVRWPAQWESGHACFPDSGTGKSASIQHWPVEPGVGRVANGVAFRVDRLRTLGNGQVPRCHAVAWLRLLARFRF